MDLKAHLPFRVLKNELTVFDTREEDWLEIFISFKKFEILI